MATHCSILAWRIPWTEEPSGYSPRDRKELDTTERLHFTSLHFKDTTEEMEKWFLVPLKKVCGDGNCILEYKREILAYECQEISGKKKPPQGPSCVVGNGKPVQHDRLVFCRHTLDSVYCDSSDELADSLKGSSQCMALSCPTW